MAISTVLPVYTADEIADYIASSYSGNGTTMAFDDRTVSVNLTGLTAEGQVLVRVALGVWDDILPIGFAETAGAAQITFVDDENGAFTSTVSSNGVIKSSVVNIGTDWLTRYGTDVDSYSYQTIVHETGHALGLGHAGPYDGAAVYGDDNLFANDTWQYTVMSYFFQSEFGSASYRFVMTPQIADIIAAQSLYGAADARSGNTVYGFNSNAGDLYDFASYDTAPAFTIYDSGGSDVIKASSYRVPQTLDLRAEHFSDIGGLVGNIAIARGVTIEKAYGGTADDVLIGNEVANMLSGGRGNDTMIGGAGNDIYVVDRIGDVIVETAGEGKDKVRSKISYTLGDNVEKLYLKGHALDATGNDLVNALYGNALDNWLDGKGGVDTMKGGDGDDHYVVNHVRDKVVEKAGQGIDTVHSSVGYRMTDNVENLVLTGDEAINGIGNALDNTLTGNDASNTLWGYGGADTLIGNDGYDLFLFAAGDADGDHVVDFAGNGAGAGDMLYFQGYGSAADGAQFAQVDGTRWQISSADGAVVETILFDNGAAIDDSDYVFA